MMTKQAFKRRTLLIDKRFQTKFLFNIYLFIFIFIFILGLLLVYLTSREMAGSVYSKMMTMKNTQQMMLPLVLRLSIIVLLLGFLIAGTRFLIFSHKIAGPMYRFKKSLNELSHGNLKIRIRFRKHDELQDIANVLTRAIHELNIRIGSIKKNSEAIGRTLKSKQRSVSKLDELKDLHDEIEKILDSFKL
ncbi:MAG: methyl-accepting chemotaxis protein [Spirochaetes bacterium]|nr:methyl-accepting chemotaxis protein [Spirochaetota bacterium]